MMVNYWAVLVCAIASMVVGSIWFGPLFGKMYMGLMGMDQWSPEKRAEMKKSMTLTYIWQFIASLVMFYVFAYLAGRLNIMTVMGYLKLAVLAWIGFIVPLKLGDALWGGKMAMFWLAIGNSLITLLVGGAILGMWK
jgi:hypothetical protein